MEIRKDCKLDKLVPADSRQYIHGHIHVGNNVAMATNGACIALVQCAVGDGDVHGPITRDSFVYARTHTANDKSIVRLHLRTKSSVITDDTSEFPRDKMSHVKQEELGLVSVREFEMKDNKDPIRSMLTCIPKRTGDELRLKLSPTLLKDLGEALGAAESITLLIDVKKGVEDGMVTGAVRVEAGAGNYGVIMPQK